MNPQISTALLILGGTGLVTIALFSVIHNTFRSAMMPNETVSTNSDEAVRYIGRIY